MSAEHVEQKSRIRLALLSIVAGSALLGLKYLSYVLSGSVALKSDAIESIVNVVAGIFALGAVVFAGQPADKEHPYGHGKIEHFSAAFEGGLISLAAVFILFATIALGLGQQGIRPRGAMLLFALGAVWTIALSLLMRALLRVRHRTSVQAAASPRPSASKLLMRWRRSLAHLPGWQYTLRITSCMAAALALERMWPEHHSYWVALTVAIVVTRKMPAALLRTVQRAVGTIVGVLLAGLLLIWALPVWAIIAVVAALAAARPILRAANYAAYAAIMTPLIMLLMDLGARPSPGVFLDRLIATVIGCAIAVTLGYLVWVRLLVPAPDVRQSKAPGNGSAGK